MHPCAQGLTGGTDEQAERTKARTSSERCFARITIRLLTAALRIEKRLFCYITEHAYLKVVSFKEKQCFGVVFTSQEKVSFRVQA